MMLPLRGLLECRLSGVRVTDLAGFYERVHGLIPIDSLKASWLIYGTGFRQGFVRTTTKRLFDIAFSVTLLLLLLPVLLIVLLLVTIVFGIPPVFWQVRVGRYGQPVTVLLRANLARTLAWTGSAVLAAALVYRSTR